MKLPEYFDLWLNIKSAAANGISLLIFLSVIGLKDPAVLSAGFVFGLLGGSINDIRSFTGNKEAIVQYNSKKEEDGQ
jgi:hypothetical protein